MFRFEGPNLLEFISFIQREFGIEPERFEPIPKRLINSVAVANMQVKATNYVQVISFPTRCDRALAMIQLRCAPVTLRISDH